MQFDPRSPEFRANPYPFYDMIRAASPIFYWDEWGSWFVSRHADCNALLRDNRLGNMNPSPGASMLFQNPPDHTRLRSLVHKAFTPRMIEQFRDQIQQSTNQLLDQVHGNGQMDVVADLAYPLPVMVITAMLGVPAEDRYLFHQWSDALVRTLDMDLVREQRINDLGGEASNAFRQYFHALFEQRRTHPSDDLISALVAVEEAGDKLSEDELHTTCRLLLIAGYETTIGLISNGVYALLRHPNQMQKLKGDPNLITSAIEECLRYDSPIQAIVRSAREDVEYKGNKFQQGQSVVFLLGAANRDEEVFEHSNTMDITRTPNPHLAFSSGIHYCLGAPLARLEGQAAIHTLLTRMPNLQLAMDQPLYRDNYVFRGLEALPITF